MSQYEVGTTRMEKHDSKNDEAVAKIRTIIDQTATLIIDKKYPCIISYSDEEGTAHTTGATNVENAKLMLMGIIDTVGNILGAATDATIDDPEQRSLAVIFLALRMLIEASDNKEMLAAFSGDLLMKTLEDMKLTPPK